MARSIDDAVAALADRADATALAGGTWIMRAPIRREPPIRFCVGLTRIPELNAVDISASEIRIGACVTHARLVSALAGVRGCEGLVTAAGSAANPAVRQMATIGGNLCASAFPASDLAPSLLSLDAEVELSGPGGDERLPVGRFLERRGSLEPGILLTAVVIPRRALKSGHARLPLRKAGDYPVAIVSMTAELRGDGAVEDIRVTVGSVEASPRRWTQLEQALLGRRLDPNGAYDLAQAEAHIFTGRDGVDAPGWYRVQVLPALARRAAQAVLAGP
ncbi:FAD binding domain-containing protein [Pseudaminobacter sp. 19-2017]|uniref:FAD binding domain-containing protein n=1 Tax=Pseudaminobacter soli (ex Zhang et al. 2022) TaxID=2831468 RepID=A0A942IAG5_9HYPH|nr:FAD binding domain-containing protein [Pseudaminobacter soli]MBS3650451.1 FAD binding domain-containing protein [Pseudaminobacter soli]